MPSVSILQLGMLETMATKRSKKRGDFLERYQTEDRLLLGGKSAEGRPAMLEAISPNGDPVLIRIWARRTKEDEDLVDIWRHELRQLYRLSGYPGAQQYFARVVDAGLDPKGFYIVLDASQ